VLELARLHAPVNLYYTNRPMKCLSSFPQPDWARACPAAAQSSKKKARSKQFKELGGIPILVHTLRKFAAFPRS